MNTTYEPPPPPNGGSEKDFLRRIEGKADAATELARKSISATLRLERSLLGDYGMPGRIGQLEAEFREFINATEQREKAHWDQSRFRISNRLASITVIVMALVGLGSIIIALVK